MVVKDGVMVTIGNTQYLQPDYYSPLPTTVNLAAHKNLNESNLIYFQRFVLNIIYFPPVGRQK